MTYKLGSAERKLGSAERKLGSAERPRRTAGALSIAGLVITGLLTGGLVIGGLVSGCGAPADSDILPTTRPVLTTLRPDLTTTTTVPIVQRRVYVVQPGDTLLKIANGFDVSVQALMTENGKEDTLLRIGEQLVIPPAAIP